jgi:hypothetical protein
MFNIFGRSSWKLWLWTESQFATKLWLSPIKLKKVFGYESQRFIKNKKNNRGQNYKPTLDESKYGWTPVFDWFHDKRQKFRDESWTYLANRYWKELGFKFDPKK